MFGPARMPAGCPGSTSSTISLIRKLVPCSRPFTNDTTGTHGRSSLASSVSTPRKPCDGTPMTMTSALSAASEKSVVAVSVSASCTSLPRYLELRCFSLMSLAVSSERTHCSVGPRRAQMDATVVPQDPPPRTTTLGSRCAGAMPISVGPTAAVSPVVDELQRYVDIGLLRHGDDGLEVVALLGADANLVALDLSLDAFGALVADELGDLLGVLAGDALFDGAADLVGLTAGLRLVRIEGLHGDVAPDELLLEDVDGGLGAFLGGGGDVDGLLALPRDGRVGAAEVEAGGQLLAGLVQRIVDLLAVNLADDIER